MDLALPPASLVDVRGLAREGAYAGAIPLASLDQVTVPGLGPLARLPGTGTILRGLRRKRWHVVGVYRDDLAVMAAVADVGYAGVAFAYVAEGREKVERAWTSPGALGFKVGTADGVSVAQAPGRLIVLAATRGGGLTVALDLPGLRVNLDVAGDATPLTVVSDLGRGSGKPGITVKSAGLTARGTVVVEGRSYSLEDAHAAIDWTDAFFPRETRWFWASGAGPDAAGRRVGLNLATGVHDDWLGRFNENALWLDGVPAALPPARFRAGAPSAAGGEPWTIHSDDGAIDLVFEPRGERSEDLRLGVLTSRYRQPFGTFTGRLTDAKGRTVRLERLPGVTEDHTAVW